MKLMNKKLALLVLAVITLGTANAQIQFGVKAGANISTFTGNDATGLNSLVGIHFGGLVHIPIAGSLALQPEVVYSGQGAKGTESGTDYSLHVNYINIPVLLKYTTSSGFYGETGPQIGFKASAKFKQGGTSTTADGFKSTDFSWAFGIGYLTTANVGIDARFNLGLSNIESGDTQGGTAKNSVFQIGVFYMFGDSGKK
jgi:hypothetical protein